MSHAEMGVAGRSREPLFRVEFGFFGSEPETAWFRGPRPRALRQALLRFLPGGRGRVNYSEDRMAAGVVVCLPSRPRTEWPLALARVTGEAAD